MKKFVKNFVKFSVSLQRKNTRASSFYVYVNVEFYIHMNVELFLHAFLHLYGGEKQVCYIEILFLCETESSILRAS